MLNLLLIHLIVVGVFHSGFIDSIDGFINERFPLRHLPPPFSCVLCSTFWASLLWTVFTGNFTLATLAICLGSALLTTVTVPLLKTVENYLLKIIELLNRPL